MSRFEVFTEFPLFEGVSVDELFSLLAKVSLDFEKYTQGDYIGKTGEPTEGLLLLMDGEADVNGQTLTAPAMLEYAHVFGQRHEYAETITAVTNCSTLCINPTSLIELLHSNTTVLTNYLNLLSNKVRP